MRNQVWIALAVALMMSAAACHKKDDKAEQLNALDKALQAGVFSKEEYDAKKQALLGAPATAPATAAASTPAPAGTPQGFDPTAVAPPGDGGVSTAPPAADATPMVGAPPAQAQMPPAVRTPPPATPAIAPAPAPAPAPKRAQSAARVPASSTPQLPPASQPPQPLPPAAPSSPPPVAPQVAQPQPPPQTSAADRGDDADPAPLAGCNDSEFRSGGAEIQERFFLVPVDAVHRAASLAFQNLDFTIHKDSKNEMEASKRKHLSAVVGAGGEKLILHFESARRGGQTGTRVTGETRKSIVGRLSQKSWTSAVLAQIGCNLRSGK